MIKKIVLLLTSLVFMFLYFPAGFTRSQPTLGYATIPDSDADFLISKRVSEGGGLYSSFSILYPPGRFIVQGLLFKLFTPSFAVSTLSHVTVKTVLFPAGLFLLAYFLIENLLQHHFSKKYARFFPFVSYVAAVVVVVINLMFLRSAQETHLLATLIFLLLLTAEQLSMIRVFILGLLFGLVFWFRFDAGILLSPLLFLSIENLKKFKPFILGFAAVWLPTLVAIWLNGSLSNFFYDTLVLGLVVQPRFMSLPIPENELRYVFLSSLIFIFSSSVALMIDSQRLKNRVAKLGVQGLAIFMSLSYVSALGRSDEAHLWYGLIWISVLIVYVVIRFVVVFFKREKISLLTVAVFVLFFTIYCWVVLWSKSPIFFLVSCTAFLFSFRYFRFSVFSVLVAGTVTSLYFFHSLSYLKLRHVIPTVPNYQGFSTDLMISSGDEIGGALMDESSRQVLDQIRKEIPPNERYLFIFPKFVLVNENLKLENPTRYIILANERTNRTEQEVIDQLIRTKTNYFLIFPDLGMVRAGPVWEWLQANTVIISEHQFPKDKAELRIRLN